MGLIIAFGSMSQFPAVELYYEHYCMGSQRNAADDPASDYLLFPGTGTWIMQIWGGGETGRFVAAAVCLYL